MSTTYHQLLRQVAFGAGMLRGQRPHEIETSYIAIPLTKSEIIEIGETPFTALKDALLNAEETLARAIADVLNHPWRRVLHSVTANITNGTVIPATDAGGVQIIGAYGAIRDAVSGKVCTARTLDVLRREVEEQAWRLYALHHYVIDGTRLYHTRTNATIDVCVYNRTTQSSALDSNGNTLLPDALGPAYVAGALAQLAGDWQSTQAGYFNEHLAMIRSGLTAVSGKPEAMSA